MATIRHFILRRACLRTGFLAVTMITFGPQPAQAAVTEAWVQRYGAEVGSADSACTVVTDAAGNVIVAGSTGDPTGGGSDMVLIKYSGEGRPLWTNRYNGPGKGAEQAIALAADGNGNVFVTGYSFGSGGNDDYATIGYSGAGVPLWTNRYDGPANNSDRATAIAVDASGDVFVTGNSGGDYATIAYSGAGVPLWTNRYNNAHEIATAVAVDASGNVFVTGSSGIVFPELADYFDYATIAYSGAGVPLWTNRYNGPANGSDRAAAMAVDGSGNVFVTGSSAGSGGDWDYATIAYSGAGVPLWTNRYNGPANGYDEARAVAVDGRGNVFVTGSSAGSGGDWDYVTIAYSGAGVPLWTNRYNGPANGYDEARAVAVDGCGNVVVTGFLFASEFDSDYATIAYSGAGVPLWTNRYNGPANGEDRPQTKSSLAIASDGAVYVTGASVGIFLSDFATVKYAWRAEIAIQLVSATPPKVNLTLSGAPNSSWAIERALGLTGPWTSLSALPIGTNGSAQFQDTNSPYPAGFYRARQQ
jgi:hypothetical protein